MLSGNRNFEGRVHPQVKANWLASPPLVVAFALAGTTRIDLTREPLGTGMRTASRCTCATSGRAMPKSPPRSAPWTAPCSAAATPTCSAAMPHWQAIAGRAAAPPIRGTPASTYVQNPPFFQHIDQPPAALADIAGARILALFGDSITTDHISPAGNIKASSPAGLYLQTPRRGRRRTSTPTARAAATTR